MVVCQSSVELRIMWTPSVWNTSWTELREAPVCKIDSRTCAGMSVDLTRQTATRKLRLDFCLNLFSIVA